MAKQKAERFFFLFEVTAFIGTRNVAVEAESIVQAREKLAAAGYTRLSSGYVCSAEAVQFCATVIR